MIQNFPDNYFTIEQKARWEAISQKLCTTLSPDDENVEVPQHQPILAIREQQGRRRSQTSTQACGEIQKEGKKATPSAAKLWGKALEIKGINLDTLLQSHLNSNTNCEPKRFLSTTPFPVLIEARATNVLPKRDALADAYFFAQMIPDMSSMDKVALLFMVLLIGDMASTMYQGQLWGRCGNDFDGWEDRLEAKYDSFSHGEKGIISSQLKFDRQTYPAKKILTDFEWTIIKGQRLHAICEHFGTGVLFWLYDLFAPAL